MGLSTSYVRFACIFIIKTLRGILKSKETHEPSQLPLFPPRHHSKQQLEVLKEVINNYEEHFLNVFDAYKDSGVVHWDPPKHEYPKFH